MSEANDQLVFKNVSKFYGEVLGVNRVDLSIAPGITSLVGPNGSGKTTIMNLMSGLLQPSQGSIHLLGMSPNEPEKLFREVGYCAQFDSFPKGANGFQFIYGYLRVHGYSHTDATQLTQEAVERVGLTEHAHRRVAGFSKGMRQRIKLAQSIAHKPSVLILDEPLNGLDPMARAEMIDLFTDIAKAGKHVIISSHILHEVDLISDQVILLNEGYIVAEGEIAGVRSEVAGKPIQMLVRCDQPHLLASKVFEHESVVQAAVHEDGKGLFISTKDSDQFLLAFNRIVLDNDVHLQSITPTDADVNAVYDYLIGSGDAT
jgi:ABC-2 type transport system ATP-binding protein